MIFNCLVHGLTYNTECPQCLVNEANKLKENKITREEAKRKLIETIAIEDVPYLITQLEALGLLKFEDGKVEKIFEIEKTEDDKLRANHVWGDGNKIGRKVVDNFGTVKIELWPEGLVLWVGGEIKWKSWGEEMKLDCREIYIESSQLNHASVKVKAYRAIEALQKLSYKVTK